MDHASIHKLSQQLGKRLSGLGRRLVTAESCTGGLISSAITDVPGCSAWFERGFITYSNESKSELLGVPVELIRHEGAVSEAVVLAMVRGALRFGHADVGVAVSGIAGPDGGSIEKPTGTVRMAWMIAPSSLCAAHYSYQGDRYSVRAQATHDALAGLLQFLAVEP